MKMPTEADNPVYQLFSRVFEKHHKHRLGHARYVIFFNDDKPFKKNRFNFGKVKKCSPGTRALVESTNHDHDFMFVLPLECWNYLENSQLEAWADLLLTRCAVEYAPEMQQDTLKNGKKKKPKPVKDCMGRVKYTNVPKYDDEGNPKWIIEPLDVQTITDNISRYGAWFVDFEELKKVVSQQVNVSV